ncbi:MAG: hypothetical protein ACMUEL_01280 [Flavobacteriales bacterium Tduv]
MLLNAFLFAILAYFLFKIYKTTRFLSSVLNQRQKSQNSQEGKTTIYKTYSTKKPLDIEAETIDFEEIKDEKKPLEK